MFTMCTPALGKAIAADGRSLVYGGGSDGIMGVVSTAAAEDGASVTGIIPYAIRAGGGEKQKAVSEVILDAVPLDSIKKNVCIDCYSAVVHILTLIGQVTTVSHLISTILLS